MYRNIHVNIDRMIKKKWQVEEGERPGDTDEEEAETRKEEEEEKTGWWKKRGELKERVEGRWVSLNGVVEQVATRRWWVKGIPIPLAAAKLAICFGPYNTLRSSLTISYVLCSTSVYLSTGLDLFLVPSWVV